MSGFTDTERFQWLIDHPDNSRQLFLLLSHQDGTVSDFISMLDRIITSERAAAEAAKK